jgi:hypothetical protein
MRRREFMDGFGSAAARPVVAMRRLIAAWQKSAIAKADELTTLASERDSGHPTAASSASRG